MSRSPYPADDPAAHAALVLLESDDADRQVLAGLRSDPAVVTRDLAPGMRQDLGQLAAPPSAIEIDTEDRWIYYPWRRQLISVLAPQLFRRLRLDRNRYKLTDAEQDDLAELTIGVIGLSVGHSIAYTLAQEGLCGTLRIADFDVIELANLNRIPVGLVDIGTNKAVVLARRIAELDPYLTIVTEPEGLSEQTIGPFIDGLDLLIEECDSLDMKIRAREVARAHRIPVLMETSDRGMFDAELFDVEPDRPLLHGLLGNTDIGSLSGLSTRDKAPHVMRILESDELSPRMAATMAEIGLTVSSWPQLAGDVQLGAATIAAAVRRYARGQLGSGRIRIDIDRLLGAIDSPPPAATDLVEPAGDSDPATDHVPDDTLEAVVHALRIAPSGGNTQPWSIAVTGSTIDVSLDRARSSAMDIADRGSYVAIGAGLFNARVAAAHHRTGTTITLFPDGEGSATVASIEFSGDGVCTLDKHYRAMLSRRTNRGTGHAAPITPELATSLADHVVAEGARLVLVTDANERAELAELLAESDRIRYLTPTLHASMMREIRWPGSDCLDSGIDVRTLGLGPADMAKLRIAARADVMEQLASWNLGHALGDDTRDRVVSSSAIAVVVIDGDGPIDYLRGGNAAERLWICAEEAGLAVHPVSPVFLYARDASDLNKISQQFSTLVRTLRDRFNRILGLEATEAPALVLRLSHGASPAARSRRMPRHENLMAQASGKGHSIE